MEFNFNDLSDAEKERAIKAASIARKLISYQAHFAGSRLIWRLK